MCWQSKNLCFCKEALFAGHEEQTKIYDESQQLQILGDIAYVRVAISCESSCAKELLSTFAFMTAGFFLSTAL